MLVTHSERTAWHDDCVSVSAVSVSVSVLVSVVILMMSGCTNV